MDKDLMWFFDDIPEDYREFQEKTAAFDKKYLEMRRALQDAENSLRAEPGNEEFQERVKQIQQRLQELEQQAPWLASDVLKEYALWGVPH